MEVDLDKITPIDLAAGDLTAGDPCDRLTVQFGIHHEHCTDTPITIHSRFSDVLQFVRRPFQDRLMVAEDWVTLDFGRMKPEEVGYVVITVPRLARAMNPSPEKKILDASKHIVVATDGDKGFRVYPGRFIPAYPEDARSVRLRAVGGPLEVNYTVMPR